MTAPHLSFGDIDIFSICGGHFRLDAGTMFGLVPRPLWEKLSPPDSQNRFRLACNCLLVRQEREITLVDTGIGDRFSDKEREIFAVEEDPGLVSSLAQAGVHPNEVTRVLFTHLHFDHFCGALTSSGESWHPTFPNAVHCVQKGEWTDALEGRSTMRTTYRIDELRFLQQQAEFHLLQGDTQVSPSISTFVTGGHTEHHQGILVQSADRTLVYPADIMPTRFHLRPYWGTSYDMSPYQSLTCKNQLVPRACDEGWLVAWNHDPQAVWNHLRFDGKNYLPEEGG
jgi:glyoxylase-like metal-dependent hydrolase (beta-lactamase superfamily II)